MFVILSMYTVHNIYTVYIYISYIQEIPHRYWIIVVCVRGWNTWSSCDVGFIWQSIGNVKIRQISTYPCFPKGCCKDECIDNISFVFKRDPLEDAGMGVSILKWWYPQNTPKWSSLVEKPMLVGYQHFRNPRYISMFIFMQLINLRQWLVGKFGA